MTTLPTSRPTVRRIASAAVALGLLGAAAGSALAGAAPASASRSTAGVTVPLAHGPLLTAENRLGDDGKRSFGVQPASAKKPDARPNLTYRDVAPGQRFFDHVAFVNVSALPVTLTVYPADALNTPEGAFDALTRDKRSTDLGSWVRLRRSQVTVPARSAYITPIEIRVPKGAEPGDHAAAIIASLRTTTKDAKGNVVNRDNRVGTRVYVRVKGDLTPRIELARTDVDFSGGLPFTGDAEVTYTVRNTGNVRLEGTQTVRVGGLFGVADRSVALPDMAELLPGNELTYTTTVKKVVPTFFNEAEVVVDPVSVTGNVDPASAQAVGSVSFLAVSWVAVLVLLVLAGVLVGLWLRRRGRRPAPPPGRGGASTGPMDGTGPSAAPAPDLSRAGALPRFADRGRVVRRRPTRTAVALALTVTGLAFAGLGAGAAPASAADGGLTFVPGRATIGTPIYAVTSAGCPKEATNVVGYIFGRGFPKAGKIVVPNQDAPVRHDGSFGVALQDNLRNFAKEEGIKRLSGPYRVEVRCADQFLTKTSATFSGTVTVTDGENFTAPVPKKPPVAGVPDLMLAQVFPAYAAAVKAQGDARNAELAAEQGRATASPAPKALETLSAPQKSVQEAAARRPVTVGSAFTVPVLVLLVVAALSGAAWLWTRGGRPDAGTRTRGAAAVTWPDDDRPRTGAGRADRR